MSTSIPTRRLAAVALAALLVGTAQARSVTSNNGGGGGLVRTACESTFSGPGVADIDCDDYTAGGGNSLGEAQGLLTAFQGAGTNVGPGFRQPTLGFIDSLVTGNTGSSNSLFDASFDVGSRTGIVRLLQRLDDEFVLNLVVLEDNSPFSPITTTGYFFFGAQANRLAGTEIAFGLPGEFSTPALMGVSSVSLYRPAPQAGASVPEPAGLLLAATALGALALASRLRRHPGPAAGASPAVPTGRSA